MAGLGEKETGIVRAILRCHSGKSGNPVIRSIAWVTGSPVFAGDDAVV
jgi:hypothetical protein